MQRELDGMEKTGQQLMTTTETLKVEKKKKAVIRKQRVEVKRQLKESSEKLKKLGEEKDEAKSLLEEKEEELEFLRLQEEQSKNDDNLKATIENMAAEVQQWKENVSRIETQMREAKESEVAAASELVEKLSEEREEVKEELERKGTELHYLHLRQQSQKNNARLRAVIERKEAEINKLRRHVSDVENELSQARKERGKLCEQLEKSTEELAKQSQHVRHLEQAQGQLQRERCHIDTKLKMEIARREV